MSTKERVTVTIDPALLELANAAVAAGRATSVSAWVNKALAEQADKERRLQGLARVIADYEAEFGAFTEEELEEQRRKDRRDAIRPNASRARERKAGARRKQR